MTDSTVDETLQVNEQQFYGDAKQFWDKMPSTVDGMLGGYEIISPKDLRGSKSFLRPLLKVLTVKILMCYGYSTGINISF